MEELHNRAIEIAKTYDVSTPPSRMVLYSISFLPTPENKDKALDFVHDTNGFVMIDQTPCGKALNNLELEKSGFTMDQIAQIWSIASLRMIKLASGNVTTFVENADKKSVFRRIELPAILENDNILTINSIDKHTFANTFFKEKLFS